MRVRYVCKCGLENHNKEDWFSHWKYGTVRGNVFLGKYPKLRAFWLFLNTRVEIH